jgi:HNH endonuclease
MEKLKIKLLQKSLRERRLAEGCCTACNNPRHGTATYCLEHIQKRRDWESKRRTRRVSNGGCGNCTFGIPIPNISICIECWWNQKGVSVGGVKQVVYLQQLWEKQDGRCALSNLPLTPGINASIDHIIPKSKSGTNDINNLRWLHTSVNSGKGTISDEHFIEICKAVASYNQNKCSSDN